MRFHTVAGGHIALVSEPTPSWVSMPTRVITATRVAAATRVLLALSFAACLFSVAFASRANQAQPSSTELASLEAVMEALAQAKGVEAHFFERKYLSLLRDPLESEGVLYFLPPDRLARITQKPAPARLVVHGNRLTLADANGVDHIDLGRSRVARQFVDQLTLLLAGNLSGLQASYSVSFETAPNATWHISLEPRSPALRRVISSIEISGQGDELRQMKVLESNGDRSETRFEQVKTQRVFRPPELAETFSLDGRLPGD